MTFDDGARTTLHVASYEVSAYVPRVVTLERPAPLARWCKEQGVRHAVVGGFFVRPQHAPLGQLQINGQIQPSVAFDAPWCDVRACVHIADETLRIARRDQLGAEPTGDFLQAGPLLIAGGRRVIADGEDPEGFSATAHQFDSDITRGRYPRAALGIAGQRGGRPECEDGPSVRATAVGLPNGVDLELFRPIAVDRHEHWRHVLVEQPQGWLQASRREARTTTRTRWHDLRRERCCSTSGGSPS